MERRERNTAVVGSASFIFCSRKLEQLFPRKGSATGVRGVVDHRVAYTLRDGACSAEPHVVEVLLTSY